MVRYLLNSALVFTAAFTLVACSPDDTAREDRSSRADSLCGVADNNRARQALSDLTGTEDVSSRAYEGVSQVAKDMRANLSAPLDGRMRSVCGLFPGEGGEKGITIEARWEKKFALEEGTHPYKDAIDYNLGEAVGQAMSDRASFVYIPCTVGGRYAEESRKRFVVANAYNQLPPNYKSKKDPRDSEMLVLNAVAQKLIDELGCTNAPLTDTPDLTHYRTMAEAAAAGADER